METTLFNLPPTAPYNGAPPHVRGSDTSEAAARSVQGDVSRMHALILDYVRQARGCSCDELEEATGLRHQTASARVRELVLLSLLEDSGVRRKTRSGRQATVWTVVRAATAEPWENACEAGQA